MSDNCSFFSSSSSIPFTSSPSIPFITYNSKIKASELVFGVVPDSVDFVDATATSIKLKFFIKGSYHRKSGAWQLSAYGSPSNSTNGTPEVSNILDANQSSNEVDLVSREVVLTGMNGCSGGDNYACVNALRGGEPVGSKCFFLKPDCKGGELTVLKCQ